MSASKAQRAYLATYIRTLADGLGLRDWRFHVEKAKRPGASPGATAASYIRWNDDHSAVWFSDEALEGSAEDLRETVIHELLHCHMERVDVLVIDALKRYVPRDTWRTFSSAWSRESERRIDRIAWAIAEHFPLPDLPK